MQSRNNNDNSKSREKNKDSDKLASLQNRIKNYRNDASTENDSPSGQDRDKLEKNAVHSGIEFTGAFLVATFLGYLADRAFQTSPVFLLLGLFLGIASGFYALYKFSVTQSHSVGYKDLHRDKKNDNKASIKDPDKDS